MEEDLVNGFQISQDRIMLVDIGGNTGNDLLELYRQHLDIPGRLILQGPGYPA